MQIGQLKPDTEAQRNGVWIPYTEGVEFRVAYMGNTSYNDKLKRLSLSARRRSHKRNMPAELETEVQVNAMVGTILTDWKNLEDGIDADGNGIPYPYSVQNATKLLTDSKEVRDFIMVECSLLENFQTKTEGESEEEGQPQADLKSVA